MHKITQVIKAGRNNSSFIAILVWLMLLGSFSFKMSNGHWKWPTNAHSIFSRSLDWRLGARSQRMASGLPVFIEFNMSIYDSIYESKIINMYIRLYYIYYGNKIIHAIHLRLHLERCHCCLFSWLVGCVLSHLGAHPATGMGRGCAKNRSWIWSDLV